MGRQIVHRLLISFPALLGVLFLCFCLLQVVPADPVAAHPRQAHGVGLGAMQRLRSTLGARGHWLVALTFGMYSGQWLAVVGFLPSIYAAAGVSGALLGVLTALAAAVSDVAARLSDEVDGDVMAAVLKRLGA